MNRKKKELQKRSFPFNSLSYSSRSFFILIINLFLFSGNLFPEIPIQEGNLNVSATNARLELINAAESYLGTPYRYGGVDSQGLDCSGLVYISFRKAFDIVVPRSSGTLYTWTEKIPTGELQPGDLVFFITTAQIISHVGIYTGEGSFIHAPSRGNQTGVTYSSLEEEYWKRTYAGAGRALPWDEEAQKALTDGFHEKNPNQL